MIIDISCIFIWIGVPKPHLRRFRLAAIRFGFDDMPIPKRSVFEIFINPYIYIERDFVLLFVFSPVWKIDAEHNSMHKSSRISP